MAHRKEKLAPEIARFVRSAQANLMKYIAMSDVVTVASLPSPPQVVVEVVQLILLLLGLRDGLTWSEMREGMRNNSKSIYLSLMALTRNTESVKSKAVWRRLRSTLSLPRMHPSVACIATKEAGALCSWLHALLGYRTMVMVIKRETGIKSIPYFKASVSRRLKPMKRKTPLRRTPARSEAEVQDYLNQSMPVLESAVVALNALDRGSIDELKSFRMPPPVVKTVTSAVFILLGEKFPSWTAAKTIALRSSSKFIQRLKNFDKDSVPDRRLLELRRFMKTHKLHRDTSMIASKAVAPLCSWVHSMVTYCKISKGLRRMRGEN